MNKSKLCSDFLMNHISRSNQDCIYLLQEPYIWKNKIPNLPSTYMMLGSKNSPRAVCIAPKHFPLFLLDRFTDRDTASILFKEGGFECYFFSLYCDRELPTISNLLTDICDFLEQKNANGIFGLDSNAHSVLYSDIAESCSRGIHIEEHVANYSLRILNSAPFVPTYQSSRFKSCIDLSWARGDIFKNIKNWSVCKKNFFTDHKLIQFDVKLN